MPSMLLLLVGCGEPPAPRADAADSSADETGTPDTDESGDTDETGDTGESGDTGGSGDTDETGDTYVPCGGPQPSMLELFRHDSPTGDDWGAPVWLMGRISVPEILLDAAIDGGSPWMFWMDFEDRADRCDRLVYAPFDPGTGAVGAIHPVEIRGLPALTVLSSGLPHPASDPELITVGSTPVLVNTLWPDTEPFPCAAIAVGIADGTVATGTFDFQAHLLWCDDAGLESHTDPLAAWLPDDRDDPRSPGVIRVFAASTVAMTHDAVRNTEWIVAVPDPADPSTWYESERRDATLQDFHMLGSLVRVGTEDCPWAIWGTRNAWVRHACTSDFETWTEVGVLDPFTSDPVVLPWDGAWQMYVTRELDYTGEVP